MQKRKGRSLWVGALVVVGAIGLSTVFIFASDTARVPGRSMLAGLGFSKEEPLCPEGMLFVDSSSGGFCIDKYEASPGKGCPIKDPRSPLDSQEDIDTSTCLPESVPSVMPWTNIAMQQADLMCARAGKRLPSNEEWYRAALGTPDTGGTGGKDDCVLGRTGADRPETTGHSRCVSSAGTTDMVGNVWEWVGETIQDGKLGEMELPAEGFVAGISSAGVPTRTSTEAEPAFYHDYFFADPTDARGMFRGGFYAMEEKAGLYSINATIPTSFTGAAIGFRCAKSIQR